jgi:hypothetical protein
LARKDRSLAGFSELASEKGSNANNNDNVNVNVETGDPDYIDKLLDEGSKKKDDLVLVGVYLQPDLAQILSRLGKKGGRGAKSRIVNDALQKLFSEKGLL